MPMKMTLDLTPAQIRQIVRKRMRGATLQALAEEYGTSVSWMGRLDKNDVVRFQDVVAEERAKANLKAQAKERKRKGK